MNLWKRTCDSEGKKDTASKDTRWPKIGLILLALYIPTRLLTRSYLREHYDLSWGVSDLIAVGIILVVLIGIILWPVKKQSQKPKS